LKEIIDVPENFVGKEWAGKYIVESLNRLERDKIDDEVTKIEYDENTGNWVPKIDNKLWKKRIILASVKHPKLNAETYDEIPPKLFDVLWEAARDINYASPQEIRFLRKKSSSIGLT